MPCLLAHVALHHTPEISYLMSSFCGGIDTSPSQNFIWRAKSAENERRLSLYNAAALITYPTPPSFHTRWDFGPNCQLSVVPHVEDSVLVAFCVILESAIVRQCLTFTNIRSFLSCYCNNMYPSQPAYGQVNPSRWDLGASDSIVRNDEISDPIISSTIY